MKREIALIIGVVLGMVAYIHAKAAEEYEVHVTIVVVPAEDIRDYCYAGSACYTHGRIYVTDLTEHDHPIIRDVGEEVLHAAGILHHFEETHYGRTIYFKTRRGGRGVRDAHVYTPGGVK